MNTKPEKQSTDASGNSNQKDSAARKEEKLNKQLDQTFPASDPLQVTQPSGQHSGALDDRKSVNSGREKKLAEEIKLNRREGESDKKS